MKTYLVAFVSTAATYVEVEADSPDEAEEKAWFEINGTLCHQCSSNVELSGDWDTDTVEELPVQD